MLTQAALIAARNSKEFVSLVEFESAIERVIGGIEKKSKILTKEERITVAYHEVCYDDSSLLLVY